MKWNERNTWQRRILPRQPVGEMTLLGAHQYAKSGKAIRHNFGNQGPRLCETVNRGAVDASNDRGEAIVIVQLPQLDSDMHELLEHLRSMLRLVAQKDHVGHPFGNVVKVRNHAIHVLQALALLL